MLDFPLRNRQNWFFVYKISPIEFLSMEVHKSEFIVMTIYLILKTNYA